MLFYVDGALCTNPGMLGMRSGSIVNSSITHSTAQPGFEGYMGRWNQRFGAWCPASVIDSASYEWVQVGLNCQ